MKVAKIYFKEALDTDEMSIVNNFDSVELCENYITVYRQDKDGGSSITRVINRDIFLLLTVEDAGGEDSK